MPYIKANGCRFAYETLGDRHNPPIFLVHGLYSDYRVMRYIAEQLSDEYFTISYTCRGHGDSEKFPYFTLVDHGRDLLALIEAFGYDHASIYGISMGSYVVLQAAILDSSNKIDHTVAVSAKGYGKTSSVVLTLESMGLDPYSMSQAEVTAHINTGGKGPVIFCPETSEEVLKFCASVVPTDIDLSGPERKAIDYALKDFDLRPFCEFITCPTLICQGRWDGLNPPEGAEELAKLIPGAKLHIAEKAGHSLPYELPGEHFPIVKEFLATGR